MNASIFPPTGSKNESRFASVKEAERDYMLFSLEFCDRVLARQPSHIEALELAANHFTALGYYADGLALDRRLATLNPDDPGVLYNLGCSLALLDKRDEALHTLRRAVDHGYRDHNHMAVDRDLASLRNDPRFVELLAMAGWIKPEAP